MNQQVDATGVKLTPDLLDKYLDELQSRYQGRASGKTILTSPCQYHMFVSNGVDLGLTGQAKYKEFKWFVDVGMLDDGVIIIMRGLPGCESTTITGLDIKSGLLVDSK